MSDPAIAAFWRLIAAEKEYDEQLQILQENVAFESDVIETRQKRSGAEIDAAIHRDPKRSAIGKYVPDRVSSDENEEEKIQESLFTEQPHSLAGDGEREGFTTSDAVDFMQDEKGLSSDEASMPEKSKSVIYPTEESPSDVWELPSGRLAKETAVKAQKSGLSTARAKRSARYEKPGIQESSAEAFANTKSRREQRYAGIDQSRFWFLRSGRSVEGILQEACLQEGATIMIRSFTIDFSCAVTKSLFSADEWEEMTEKNVFKLPELPPSTTRFLLKMRKALIRGKPACEVPLPNIDKFACTLVQDSCKIWQRLYGKTPSPFTVEDLSEAFWARKSWPLLTEFLDDMDNLFMIDEEKSGIESGKQRNSDRKYHPDTQTPRKQVERKLDLVVRDVIEKKDYMIVECMKDWDEYSTKFLKETSVDLFREMHTIMMHRLQDTRNEELWDKGRFFGIYTGGCGFQTFELRPAGGRSYVSLFHKYPIYELPTSIQNMKPQIQGLTHLLQVRQLMSNTITLSRTSPVETFEDEGDGKEEEDSNWIYGSTHTRLGTSINLALSPSAWNKVA